MGFAVTFWLKKYAIYLIHINPAKRTPNDLPNAFGRTFVMLMILVSAGAVVGLLNTTSPSGLHCADAGQHFLPPIVLLLLSVT